MNGIKSWHSLSLAGCFLLAVQLSSWAAAPIQAGASAVDITPPKLPVIRNGGFIEATLAQVDDRLRARGIVLADESTRLAIVVVDSCMVPLAVCDQAKQLATERTGIPANRILISATHTHNAPSVMNYCLGSRADPAYTQFLPGKIAAAIEQAVARLQPAQVGWAVVDAGDYTQCRRWITRPDKTQLDPFGERTVRAMMHPGYQNPDFTGESGPTDPWLSLLSIQSVQGKPIALLANFAMHYFGGHPGVSADYFGRFADGIAKRLAPEDANFVGIMSQGTSGDLWRADYSQPRPPDISIEDYTAALIDLAARACKDIQHRENLTLAMAEKRLTLGRRTPDAKRLAWAREMMAGLGGQRPRNRPEVYAEQAIFMHENPTEPVVLQAIRLGGLGITAIPNEVYALTGLKLKSRSPLQPTINIELANGAAGYIPPPEQHHLGGYNTWPARTAGLEVEAEPKIVEAVLGLLEAVSGQSRRTYFEPLGSYAQAVMKSKPLAYWRMADQNGSAGEDASGTGNLAEYEMGIAYHLPGVDGNAFGAKYESRAAHFAGGRMKANIAELGADYSVELWFWNAMPDDARPVAGYLFSRGKVGDQAASGDHFGIGGLHSELEQGKLIVFNGNARNQLLIGRTSIPLRTWNHVVMIREGNTVRVHLNGDPQPDLEGRLDCAFAAGEPQIFVGGRSDNLANFEGKIDEAALYGRAMTSDEIVAHYQTARPGLR